MSAVLEPQKSLRCDFFSGFVAICERFAGEEFFTAIVYHEWFIIENSE